MVIVDVLAITSLQRDLPGDVLSRVLGVFDTLVLAGILLASLATGILLAHADVNVALIAVGAGIPAIGLIGPAHPAACRPHIGGGRRTAAPPGGGAVPA